MRFQLDGFHYTIKCEGKGKFGVCGCSGIPFARAFINDDMEILFYSYKPFDETEGSNRMYYEFSGYSNPTLELAKWLVATHPET